MPACTPSIHVFIGRPLSLLSCGIHSIIDFVILSSGILFTWPYHCSLFCCIISMMSGFPFTPIVSFVFMCSFFILSLLDFLAHHLSTCISVDKIVFISLVGKVDMWTKHIFYDCSVVGHFTMSWSLYTGCFTTLGHNCRR